MNLSNINLLSPVYSFPVFFYIVTLVSCSPNAYSRSIFKYGEDKMSSDLLNYTNSISADTIAKEIGINISSESDLIEKIKGGLPFSSIGMLRERLNISSNALLLLISMSRTTYNRRKEAGILNLSESNIIVRYIQIYSHALNVFEDPILARKWLSNNSKSLNGTSPLEYISTERGAYYVNNILINLEMGNYVA